MKPYYAFWPSPFFKSSRIASTNPALIHMVFGAVVLFALVLGLAWPAVGRAEQRAPVIVVGSEIDFPPYAIVGPNGRPSGFSVELLEAVAEVMGLSIEIVSAPWAEVLAEFKDGRLDLLPLVALSKQRADMATYTKPHTVANDCFFVRRGTPPIRSLAEAKGKSVAVMSSDAAHEELEASGVQVRTVETKTIPDAMRLLAAGHSDAVLVPKLMGYLVLRKLKLMKAIEGGPVIPDYQRRFAFAVQPGNYALRDKLDQGIAIVRATGRYDEIYSKWFGGIEPQNAFPWCEVIMVASAMGLLLLLILSWTLILRRQVAARTKELEQANLQLLNEVGERQRAEERVRVIAENLERRVAERTIDLEKEINERKLAEEALSSSESRIRTKLEAILSPEGNIGKLELADIIDVAAIQGMMDGFFSLTNIGVAILDNQGKVLVSTGWQDICTKFHRVHPEACKNCLESDLELSTGVGPGEFKIYKCKNNMWDMVTPIIVGGEHVGNLYLGQFFFEDETPNYETFRSQARQYGFDENAYINALDNVPRWSRETVNTVMDFYSRFAGMVSTLGYSNLKLARAIEEGKRAEKALRDSEEKFGKLYLASPVWMSLTTLDEGRFLEVNQAFEQVSGYSRGEAVGRTATELGLWPDPGQRQDVVDKLKRHGAIRQELVLLRMRSGELRHFLWSAELVPLGNEQAMLNALLDITDLQLAQEALAESEQSFRTVVENSLAGIYVIQDGKWSYVNPRLAEMLGYDSPEELTGKVPWELVHPEDRDLVQSLGSAREKYHIKTNPYTFRALTKDGRVVWLETMGAHANYKGRPANVSNVVDITKRKLAEDALQKSEEQYRLLVSAAQDAIYIIQDGKLVFANPQVEKVTGMSAEELADTNFSQLLHPDDLELALQRYRKRLAGENVPDNYPLRVIGKDGQIRWIQASAVPLTWKKQPAILYIARDITEQRLMEVQLRQAQKMEAVGTLAGGIAHDFNNILAVVMGYAEIALAEVENYKAGPTAEIQGILKAATRAKNLVQQILTYSRRTDLQLRMIDINKEISSATNLLKQTLPRMINIRLELSEGIPLVMGDPHQIERIIINLGANSRDAMPEGGTLAITTSLEEVEGITCLACSQPFDGEYVLIAVTDTGLGMSKEVLARIFDPFFTTKEVGKGTGLGLATLFGIVKSHGGHVNCSSELGKGTTFNIYLPPADGGVVGAVEDITLEDIKGGPETILLVDDELNILEIGEHTLSRAGYKVLSAVNGEEALDIFKANKQEIALVILDLSMPGMGGYRCLQGLLSLSPALKVIMATGYARDGDLKRTMSSGAVALLTKPFSKNEMLKTVRRVLDA